MNTETIKDIIKIFEDSQLAKMELEADDMKIKMEKPTGKEVTYAPTTTLPLAPQPKEAPVQTAVQEEKKAGYWVNCWNILQQSRSWQYAICGNRSEGEKRRCSLYY